MNGIEQNFVYHMDNECYKRCHEENSWQVDRSWRISLGCLGRQWCWWDGTKIKTHKVRCLQKLELVTIVFKIFIDYKLEHVYNDEFCKAEWNLLQTSY